MFCVAFGGTAIAGDSVHSAARVIAPDQLDPVEVSAKMDRLYSQLLAGRSKVVTIDLGSLSAAETGFLDGGDSFDKRRLLVGVDRPVDLLVDLGATRSKTSAIGSSHTLFDGTTVWSASFRSPGATALRAHLVDVNLPEGAKLYVYGDHGDAFGPYSKGEVWTNTVIGEVITLQLELSSAVAGQASFVVASLGHMGESFELARWQQGFQAKAFCSGTSGPVNEPCVYNADCSSVPPAIATAAPAIGEMLYASGSGYYICTGGLVADVDATMTPYFLTANHCVSTSTEAASLETYWDFTAPCGTTSCSYAWDSGRNTPGATILSTNSTSDYTLLQLDAIPSGRTFLGWTTTAVAYSNGTGLYRLSHPSGAPQAYSEHSVSTTAGTCSSWPRGNWIYSKDTYGATEGGSSGSPVLNANGDIVGQLSGGCGTNVYDVCDSVSNATVDGAFAAYFPAVSPWLENGDPPTCGDPGAPCSSGADCCSGRCHPRKLTCR
jgi:V8-like Glu-specific endopeptidase